MQAEKQAVALASGLGLGLGATNAWWLARNELPDGFQNEYEHLYTLTEIVFRTRDGGLGEAWTFLWDGYYPPLMHGVSGLWMAVVGVGPDRAVLAVTAFAVVLAGATAWLAERLRPGAGVAAAALLLSYPAIFGNARRYEPNVPLAAMLALAVAWLVGRGLRDRRSALVLGTLVGLGMLADRLVFGVFLAPALAVWAWRRRGSRGAWLAAGASALLVCGYYYARFVRNHLWEVASQLGVERTAGGELTNSFPPWTPLGLGWYPLSFVDDQMGLLLALATASGLLGWWRVRRDLDVRARDAVEAWAAGGFAVLTLLGKKQPFYSVPLLAPLAVMAAVAWRGLPGRWRAGVAAVVAVAALHQGVFLTTGSGLLPTPGRWAWFAGVSPLPAGLLGDEYTMAWAPRETSLDLDRMAELCRGGGRAAPEIAVFSDAHGAYEGQLMPALRLAANTLSVEAVEMSGPAVVERAGRIDCWVTVQDEAGWPSSDAVVALYGVRDVGEPPEGLLHAVAAEGRRVSEVARWDGGGMVVQVWR